LGAFGGRPRQAEGSPRASHTDPRQVEDYDESRAYAAALQRLDEELAPLRAAHGSLPGRGVEQRFWGPAPSSGQEQAEIRRAWDARRAANG
jgi:hypothetical protein